MKKIDLTPYKVGEDDYKVKEVLVSVLFNAELRLNARAVIEQDALAKKIEASNGSVLLEDADYARVKKAVETVSSYGRGDLQFVERVLNAPDVPVKEA